MPGDEMNLPIFHGNRTDDPKQYWFLCEAVWTAKQSVDNDIKRSQLATTLRGHALYWYQWDSCRFLKGEWKKHWMRSRKDYSRNLRNLNLRPNTLQNSRRSSSFWMKLFGILINGLRRWWLEPTLKWAMFSIRSGSLLHWFHTSDNR